ncbi:hypothetical protein J8273_3799 [Carpediemonas membranifera]|uniref:Uncharacterized protein n=1 Tax=Carpediemonas membranifera TaxID=201153 RepID=A0A8J6BYJ2_9EUKA|nr:hypothetical protein J8273_3799 [Carpediemonas membranifera]|eukprot:KAG9394551.1 hypothetical protein J8273_3799 [Carpediemonas membranifera]
MDAAESTPDDVKDAIISVYHVSVVLTAEIPGDVPSLLRHAYSRHFNQVMPSVRDQEIHRAPESSATLETLSVMLTAIPPLAPKAQVLLDRAQSILTDGPPLSMNVELAEGEELPVALHTLLQGTLWATLLHGFNSLNLAECPGWLLCKKFLFSYRVSEKDGVCECFDFTNDSYCLYAGHLLINRPQRTAGWVIPHSPRVLRVYSSENSFIGVTPKGLFGWGSNRRHQLGFPQEMGGDITLPTRVTFPQCPEVAAYESRLPSWQKHCLVSCLVVGWGRTLMFTPAGVVIAGHGVDWFSKDVLDTDSFYPVNVPHRFFPDQVLNKNDLIILTTADRQLIAGVNDFGQLGIGSPNARDTDPRPVLDDDHNDDDEADDEAGYVPGFGFRPRRLRPAAVASRAIVSAFVPLTFPVDGVLTGTELGSGYGAFNIFLGGRQLLFAGRVPYPIAQSGLLPSYSNQPKALCHDAKPLLFSASVKAFFCNEDLVVWVEEGLTHCWAAVSGKFTLPFESTHVGQFLTFRDGGGQWFAVCVREWGVAYAATSTPDSFTRLEEVQVDSREFIVVHSGPMAVRI